MMARSKSQMMRRWCVVEVGRSAGRGGRAGGIIDLRSEEEHDGMEASGMGWGCREGTRQDGILLISLPGDGGGDEVGVWYGRIEWRRKKSQ